MGKPTGKRSDRSDPHRWRHRCFARAVAQLLSGDLHQIEKVAAELAEFGDETEEAYLQKLRAMVKSGTPG